MPLLLIVRPEEPVDQRDVRIVNQAAFGGDAEADLVDALRTGGYAELSLVAEIDARIVGHLLFSRVTINTHSVAIDALSLAPMAVLPGHQRQGIGTQLVTAGLDECRTLGHKAVLVLGHPDFYQRFGFKAELARSLASPFGGGDEWMALELQPGVLEGVQGQVEFSPPFAAIA